MHMYHAQLVLLHWCSLERNRKFNLLLLLLCWFLLLFLWAQIMCLCDTRKDYG